MRCNVEHVGLVLSGCATAAMEDGTVYELRTEMLFHITPDLPVTTVGWSATRRTFPTTPRPPNRTLTVNKFHDHKQKGPDRKIGPFRVEFIPAATYVPTQLPVQYHRPGEA
jgi:hypothetical protein